MKRREPVCARCVACAISNISSACAESPSAALPSLNVLYRRDDVGDMVKDLAGTQRPHEVSNAAEHSDLWCEEGV